MTQRSRSRSSLSRSDTNSTRTPSGDTRGWISFASVSVSRRVRCPASRRRDPTARSDRRRPGGRTRCGRLAPRRPSLVALHRRHPLGGAARRQRDVDVEPSPVVTRKRDTRPVGRPRRLALHSGLSSRQRGFACWPPGAKVQIRSNQDAASRAVFGDHAGSLKPPRSGAAAWRASAAAAAHKPAAIGARRPRGVHLEATGRAATARDRLDDVAGRDAEAIEQLFRLAAARNLANCEAVDGVARSARPLRRPRRRGRPPRSDPRR